MFSSHDVIHVRINANDYFLKRRHVLFSHHYHYVDGGQNFKRGLLSSTALQLGIYTRRCSPVLAFFLRKRNRTTFAEYYLLNVSSLEFLVRPVADLIVRQSRPVE